MIRRKSWFLLVFCVLLSSVGFSQKKRDILFKIDGKPQLASDFVANYKKNIDIVTDANQKKIDNYLNLYINYKLKVLKAEAIGLDTLPGFIGELSRYKEQLMTPYLKDSMAIEGLVKEAYQRTKNEVDVSHILIRVTPLASPADTLKAYQKIKDIQQKLKSGVDFSTAAYLYSEDPSAKINRGDLGYFRAFNMIYKFENEAFNTKVGQMSDIFRTRFGYHIIKVNDKRLSPGSVQVAHIMLKNTDSLSVIRNKSKIDSLYGLLQHGAKFADLAKTYSQDVASAPNGGVLAKIDHSFFVKTFANQAFALSKIDSFSKPFRTRYGWHIVKLLKKIPVPDYKTLYPELLDKVKRSRADAIDDSVVNRLKRDYQITDYNPAIAEFYKSDWYKKRDSLNKPILKVQDSIFTQHDFVVYLEFKHLNKNINKVLYNMFKDRKIIEYYKSHLERTNKAFAASVNQFREGLLLFNVMQKEVWNKAKTDSIGLQSYFLLNQNKYPKGFTSIKGKVINDYQNYLEQNFIATLRASHKIEIRKPVLNRLKRQLKTFEN